MPSELPNSDPESLVTKREIAEELLRYGVDARQVAVVTKLPIKTVQAISTVRETTTLAPADQEIAEAMRNLAWMAYEEAVYLIQFGSPVDRTGLIKLILGRSMNLIGAEKSARFDEMRTVFEDMMQGIRSSDDTPLDLPMDDDVEAIAAAGDTDYPG
jgi:uncharacterized protein (DUF2235 family)